MVDASSMAGESASEILRRAAPSLGQFAIDDRSGDGDRRYHRITVAFLNDAFGGVQADVTVKCATTTPIQEVCYTAFRGVLPFAMQHVRALGTRCQCGNPFTHFAGSLLITLPEKDTSENYPVIQHSLPVCDEVRCMQKTRRENATYKRTIRHAAEEACNAQPAQTYRCNHCRQLTATRKCTCRHAFYCDTACQRADWKAHKDLCLPMRKKGASSS